ncbi:MAG: Cysteine--tRNA ligase [Chlamydiia bacterium]|nr:Cysteine--tRNA ligase [Chlamydiia bacterium]MCH9619022.1 Cysteine--tRNA ligase [Chlamydiia bacterium]MCH9624450.1 Cysteine--tRNA ligase [Chlamydiia bacterium]
MEIFDTKQRKKVTFSPEKNNTVRMYTCGPTIYNYAHIGNLRTFVFEDLLRRTIKFLGMDIFHVMNLTDIDDKTIKGALEKGVSLKEYTEPYEQAFLEDLKTLSVEKAEKYPKATEFIPEMIKMISELIDKGNAYRTDDGDVFFRIHSFDDYGALSHLKMDDLEVGKSTRIDSDEYEKEAATDFVLWKGYKKERDGDIYWESPFGKGRPGWHIECSCMSMHYLGETFDLHTGGVDNIFPHHENEIAQSEACSGKTFVRHWMHSEHLLVEGKKMSKSLGNFYTLRDLINKGYSGREVRALFLSSHYRTQLNFTFDGLLAIRKSLSRLDIFIERISESKGEVVLETESFEKQFLEAVQDDLNTPVAFAVLFDFIRYINGRMDEQDIDTKNIVILLEKWENVFGFIFTKEKEEIETSILEAAEKRFLARKEKDYTLADTMRKLIEAAGYTVEDTKEKCLVRKKENYASDK